MSQVHQFYQSLSALQGDFERIGDDAKARMKKMETAITKLAHHVNQQQMSNKQSPLADLFALNLTNAKTVINSFEQSTQDYMHNTQFRDQFSDSLLVFVYGKVNAGKSSLGNFVARHPDSGHIPAFFRYDEAGQARNQAELEELKQVEGFEIKETEATSSIQGFRLPALSWIDTPGLHSMTVVNGQLAQDYIDAADLVLYITSSDSPGRSTDAQEITDLIQLRAKKVCVLLTKSDITEEDETDDGELVSVLVAKSPEVRSEQEQWVKQQLRDYLQKDADCIGDVLSVSVLLAKNSLENKNNTDWKVSNLDVFYHLLNHQAIKQAKALKLATPRKRLNSLLMQVLQGKNAESASLQQIKQQFSELKTRAVQDGNRLLACQQAVWDDVETELRGIVAKIVDQHAANKDSKAVKRDIEMQFPPLVKRYLSAAIAEHIQQFNDHLPLDLQLQANVSLRDKTESISYTVSHSGKGAALGALAGGFFGPVGALVGGALGGLAGKALSESKERTIVLGDNREEVIHSLISELEKSIKSVITHALQQVNKDYFLPVQNLAVDLVNNLMQLESELNTLRYPTV